MDDERTDFKWWQWIVLAFLALAGFGLVWFLWVKYLARSWREGLARKVFYLGAWISPEKEQDRYPAEVWSELQYHRRQATEYEARIKKLIKIISNVQQAAHKKE